VYGEFKDLFRGSVSLQTVLEDEALQNRIAQCLIDVKFISNDLVCDLKLTLAFHRGWFELQVLPGTPSSHELYELLRHPSLENIRDFIKGKLLVTKNPAKAGLKRSYPTHGNDVEPHHGPPQPM